MQVTISLNINDNEVALLSKALEKIGCLFSDESYERHEVEKAIETFIRKEAETIALDLESHANKIWQQSDFEPVYDVALLDEADFRWSDPMMAAYASTF